jgi:hypothetical protein
MDENAPSLVFRELLIMKHVSSPVDMIHTHTKKRGKRMNVVLLNEKTYFLGVEIAKLLQRETYNLYRSLHCKGIPCYRATPVQVDYMLKAQILKYGSRSATLVPVDKVMPYIEENLKKTPRVSRKTKYDSSFILQKDKTQISSSIVNKKNTMPNNSKERSFSSRNEEDSSGLELLCQAIEFCVENFVLYSPSFKNSCDDNTVNLTVEY